MCLAIPAKVLSIKGKHAKVDYGSIQKEINLGVIKPKVGDYVLVSSGFAVEIISEKDADKILKEWKIK